MELSRASTSKPPILVVEQDPPLLPLSIQNDFPDLRFDCCSSIEEATIKLRNKRYQTLIADVRLALSRGGSLLALNHSEQWTAPSILIAKFPDDRSLVRQGMKQGALDFVAKPVNRGEAVAAITVALWLNELKIQVAYRKETLVGLRSEHAVLSVAIDARVQTRSLNEKILSTEEVLRSCEKTMEAVENSLSFLTRTAEGLEQKTRERALHRLPNS